MALSAGGVAVIGASGHRTAAGNHTGAAYVFDVLAFQPVAPSLPPSPLPPPGPSYPSMPLPPAYPSPALPMAQISWTWVGFVIGPGGACGLLAILVCALLLLLTHQRAKQRAAKVLGRSHPAHSRTIAPDGNISPQPSRTAIHLTEGDVAAHLALMGPAHQMGTRRPLGEGEEEDDEMDIADDDGASAAEGEEDSAAGYDSPASSRATSRAASRAASRPVSASTSRPPSGSVTRATRQRPASASPAATPRATRTVTRPQSARIQSGGALPRSSPRAEAAACSTDAFEALMDELGAAAGQKKGSG